MVVYVVVSVGYVGVIGAGVGGSVMLVIMYDVMRHCFASITAGGVVVMLLLLLVWFWNRR